MQYRIYNLIDRIACCIAYVGGAILLGIAGLVVFEVIARRAFAFTITGVDELSGFAYAISMAWGFSYALLQKSHIRVDFVYARLPDRVRAALDVVALLSMAGLMMFLSLRSCAMLRESISMSIVSSSPLQVPLWIPQLLWLSGIIFFVFCLWLLLCRSVYALFDVAGDPRN